MSNIKEYLVENTDNGTAYYEQVFITKTKEPIGIEKLRKVYQLIENQIY